MNQESDIRTLKRGTRWLVRRLPARWVSCLVFGFDPVRMYRATGGWIVYSA